MNPMLQKAKDDLEANIPDQYKEDYLRYLVAGLKLINDPKSHERLMIIKNKNAKNRLVEMVPKGVTNLALVLLEQSRKALSAEGLIFAAMTLTIEILDIAEREVGATVTKETLAAITKKLVENLFALLKVSPQQLQEAIVSGYNEIQGATK